MNDTLTRVSGILVGHITDWEAATGCTVVLCPLNTVGGVDVRGGAPGTRETDLLGPGFHVEHVNAIMLAGGSAFGLAAADGAMRYLEAQGQGYQTRSGHRVPIVASAILFDLALGSGTIRPDARMGYEACAAATDHPVEQGSVGAGTGCRIGAMLGNAFATKGGIGSAAIELDTGLIVSALVAVNSVGDVIDEEGNILAGVRQPPEGRRFADMLQMMQSVPPTPPETQNTVIGVIATNARLSKVEVNRIAQMAHDGLARAIRPAHTMYDGDTLFALATGEMNADVNLVGAFAAEVVSMAIRNAVRAAKTWGEVRAYDEGIESR